VKGEPSSSLMQLSTPKVMKGRDMRVSKTTFFMKLSYDPTDTQLKK
jgi:hypothetical protein